MARLSPLIFKVYEATGDVINPSKIRKRCGFYNFDGRRR